MYSVMYSRDFRILTSELSTADGRHPMRIVSHASSGNYVGSSKSMESESTREVSEKIGPHGRSAITAIVADEGGGLKN